MRVRRTGRGVDISSERFSTVSPWITMADEAFSPISRPREGLGAIRLDGPMGRVDRLGEPAWRRVHPLPSSRHCFRFDLRQSSRGSMRRRQDRVRPGASRERRVREYVEEAGGGALSRSVHGRSGRACGTPLVPGASPRSVEHCALARGAPPPSIPPEKPPLRQRWRLGSSPTSAGSERQSGSSRMFSRRPPITTGRGRPVSRVSPAS